MWHLIIVWREELEIRAIVTTMKNITSMKKQEIG